MCNTNKICDTYHESSWYKLLKNARKSWNNHKSYCTLLDNVDCSKALSNLLSFWSCYWGRAMSIRTTHKSILTQKSTFQSKSHTIYGGLYWGTSIARSTFRSFFTPDPIIKAKATSGSNNSWPLGTEPFFLWPSLEVSEHIGTWELKSLTSKSDTFGNQIFQKVLQN